MKLSRVPLSLIATAAVSSLMLTACGGSGGDDDARAAKDAPKSTAQDINKTDPAKLKQGGTLNWGIDQLSTQWNVLEIDGADYATNTVMQALMPSLWHATATGEIVPNKAFLLDAQSKEEGGKQIVTYHLNPKAKWSDGTPITYKDLEANVKVMSGKDKEFKIAAAAGYEEVTSVAKGKDDYEAVVTFGQPYADWRALFGAPNNTPIYPAKYFKDAESFNSGYLNKIPVTGNAFKLGSIDKTAQTVTIVADKDFWGDKAKLDKIVFHAMEGSTMPGAFSNGELDTFNVGPDASAFKQASKVKGATIREAGGPNYRHLTLNGKSPLLTDVKVRQAIFQAVDRETIAKSDLKNLGWKPTVMNNHFLVNNAKGYQENGGDLAKYDPKAAAKLLDEAGWKLNGEVRKKDGKELALRLVIPSGTAVSANEGSMLTQMLGQVGIKVKIQSVPSNDFFTKYIDPNDFDMSVYALMGTPFPSSGASNVYTTKGGNNEAQVGSEKVDELMKKASRTTDAEASLKVINETDAEVWKLAGLLTLYQRPDIVAVKSNLANFGAFGMADVTYEHIGYTK
ncbi:ABC transporter family substrate-binding protein [Streptomyces sp. MST-110588]|uniref:ABC transporter family substrate-binding protein n=1 Tax=Streptomyces sp. MST-110588 TaxID=2833628 RepID=UPI001F5DC89F|nr:ABC transporter family substrate-binding protein [Streptomyces sp. MST-110588]UNO41454.1 ABC transporter family substrate-binding protein [Streptomyces sp. MST-110588]